MPGKRMRGARACVKAYSFALGSFDKYATITSARNVHCAPEAVYTGLMHLSRGGGYAESTMEDLRLKYGMDAPCGGDFLYRL